MSLIPRKISWKIFSLWLGGLWFGIVLVYGAGYWVGFSAARDLSGIGQERLSLYQGTLRSALEKHRYLPFVLSRDEGIKKLLSENEGREGVAIAVNRSLRATNQKAESDVLYVLNSKGTTLAASNWLEDRSFVGHNYAFRPYYKDAIEGRESGFFAVGATTGVPGYFMSHAVHDQTGVRGVIVAKVDMRPLQKQWHDGGEHVFVTDANGVIFLSSRDDWRYQTISPINTDALANIRSNRQFGGAKLLPLDLRFHEVFDRDVFEVDGHKYLALKREIGKPGWVMHFLTPLNLVLEKQRTAWVSGAVLLTLVFIGSLFLRERRQKLRSAQRAQLADRFQVINKKLQLEIDERKRTEMQLLKTQEDLVQTGKLAALGQMSTAIAHEINQPMAAIRTFAASARLLLAKGKKDSVKESLIEISSLTKRMSNITGELNSFAQKTPVEYSKVDLREALINSINLMGKVWKPGEIDLNFQDLGISVFVKGDLIRLEQVFVNLLRNAADAMGGQNEKKISVYLRQIDQLAIAIIEDNGTGIDPQNLDQIFDPFFTTKEVGEGVGLGLSISYGIVKDFGGNIRVENREKAGTRFIVEFSSVLNCDVLGAGARKVAY
ncbi:ATP-binding protein [Kiloniella sp. EL199]|uniref:sensor histidine kinase n=1 Tax=Kiloniella sp. EL199 TaxID=2107581 RepID=UPI000EA2457C|nr:ATP-binding protein [Kiloniella sp. EL199]